MAEQVSENNECGPGLSAELSSVSGAGFSGTCLKVLLEET